MNAKARATDQILHAAIKLFGEGDPAVVTVDEVAREADLSRGLVVYHFGGMSQLLHTIAEYLLYRFRQVSELDHNAPDDYLVASLQAWEQLLVHEPEVYRCFLNFRGPNRRHVHKHLPEGLLVWPDQWQAAWTQALAALHASDAPMQAMLLRQWWEGASLLAWEQPEYRERLAADGLRMVQVLLQPTA